MGNIVNDAVALPVTVIDGVEVYPLPVEIIVISSTAPFLMVATAVAWIPQDSDGAAIVTVGAVV